MKYLSVLTILVLVACNKAPNRPVEKVEEDSVRMQNTLDSLDADENLNNSEVTPTSSGKNARTLEGSKVVYEIPASHLPITLEDEFGDGVEELNIKISKYQKKAISAAIIPESPTMNIRFNQIKLPNGELDGPFGRELNSYKFKNKGQVWLMIGKSNMASGKDNGKFKVEIK